MRTDLEALISEVRRLLDEADLDPQHTDHVTATLYRMSHAADHLSGRAKALKSLPAHNMALQAQVRVATAAARHGNKELLVRHGKSWKTHQNPRLGPKMPKKSKVVMPPTLPADDAHDRPYKTQVP